MNQFNKADKFYKDKDFTLFFGLFILLTIYLILRVLRVPMFEDEIRTKWTYMIDFNPLPYMGYVDANNHFLNSFAGGIFYRLFGFDANWVFRLGSLLSFPIYFWSIYGFKSFFQKKYTFRLFAALLLFSSFIIEYFGFARGYGMSMAFMALAIQQTLTYVRTPKLIHPLIILIAWILAISANLTLLPFALFGLAYIGLYAIYRKKYVHVLFPFIGLFPIYYLLKYSFYLRDIGKLYYGGQEGFFENTVYSLTDYLWGKDIPYLEFILSFLFICIVLMAIIQVTDIRKIFIPNTFFAILLFLSVINIQVQNHFFGINFPEDRSAIYLVIFFFGALAFMIDYVNFKIVSWIFTTVPLVFFLFQLNFTHSIFWFYEHFDEKLLTEMNADVEGIPPSTGGRFWSMDNELTKSTEIGGKVMQDVSFPQDSILDYIVINDHLFPKELRSLYIEKYEDPISHIKLYKRKQFLKRSLIFSDSVEFDFNTEFSGFSERSITNPGYLRVRGTIEKLNLHRKAIIVVSVDNEEFGNLQYLAYNLVESLPIDDNGNIHFDLTFGVNPLGQEAIVKVYYWNQRKYQVKGSANVNIYEIPLN